MPLSGVVQKEWGNIPQGENVNINVNKIAIDPSFNKLHAKLNKFNVFRATGMENQEIKHTQFLSFLLNPSQSHGFKDEFISRFIRSLAPSCDGIEIAISDMNLGYARINPEAYFKKNGMDSSSMSSKIDILIEIPSFEHPEKIHLLVIENKIKAKQSKDQLKRYRETVLENYNGMLASSLFFYLNVSEEEPDDPEWNAVVYKDTVIPTLDDLLNELDETTSDYMQFLLKDYCEFIRDTDGYDSEDVLQELVSLIGQDIVEEVKRLADLPSPCPMNLGIPSAKIPGIERFRSHYQTTIQFLKKIDLDPRKSILEYFDGILFSRNGGLSVDLEIPFRHETSNKTWMRFSFLHEGIRAEFAQLCQNPTKKWLDSNVNLAYELYFKKLDDGRIECNVSLILGPTGMDFSSRDDLLWFIRRIFNDTHKQIDTSLNTRGARSHYDAIKKGYFRNLRATVSTPDEGCKWIDKTLKYLAKTERSFVDRLNQELPSFIDSLRS